MKKKANDDSTQDEILQEDQQEINDAEFLEEDEKIQAEDPEVEIEPEEGENKKDFEDKYLRLLADYDNLKRRSAIEQLSSKNNGKIIVFKELLDILDNFQRALSYDIASEEFKKGIDIVYKQFNEKLASLGLEKVASSGLMDHNIHQAVMTESNQDFKDDEIIEVMQDGYILEEKLIRPAMVKVNKIETNKENNE